MKDKIYDIYKQEIELTSEQKACLKYTGGRTLMVKGYAGAGKSLVLMAIAKKYLDTYGKDAKSKVAFITFQNTLASAMREFLIVNGQPEEGVVVNTINSYMNDIYSDMRKSGSAPRVRYPSGKNREEVKKNRLENVKNALRIHQSKYGEHRFHKISPSFWLEEFDWMKEMNVWKDDLDYYLTLPRKGRGNKVRMSPVERVKAYQLFVCYCDYLERTGQGDWEDQTLFIVRHPELIPDNKRFDHVLIDEAQDLSLSQMIAVMQLYKKNMIVAMDMNQKIHSKYWTPKMLGIESTTKKLTKSMRTTVQIEALAESIRSKNDANLSDDDKSVRAIPERVGEKPKIVHLDDKAAEQKYVVNLVKSYLHDNPKITIGIIAATNKQIKLYSYWLASADVPHEKIEPHSTFSMAKPGVKVVGAYGAKGLEFNCVIIPMFAEGYFPYNFYDEDDNDDKEMNHLVDQEALDEFMIKMRNLVYVSMTRAKNLLTITYWGRGGSRFIGDMDPNLYEWEGKPFTPPKISTLSKTETVSGTGTNSVTSSNSIIAGSTRNNATGDKKESLIAYLKTKGLEVIDKREKGGALWVVGDKRLDPILKESRKRFGALWIFADHGSGSTRGRQAWYTKCEK